MINECLGYTDGNMFVNILMVGLIIGFIFGFAIGGLVYRKIKSLKVVKK
jgi:hypothetical protein